jgi:hypothetical protein
MDKQKQIQSLNEVLALIDSVRISGSDALLVVRIKETVLAVGNSIAQELAQETQPKE